MKFNSTLLTFVVFLFFSLSSFAQKSKATIQVFKNDKYFSQVAVDASNNVFALVNKKGMFKFDQKDWVSWDGKGTAISSSYLWQLAFKGNDVWVASSGYVLTLGQTSNTNFSGGVYKISNNNPTNRQYLQGRPILGQMIHPGPPTRNIRGIYIDTTGRIWCAAAYHDSISYATSRYYYAPGAVGRFNDATGNFDFITGADLPDPSGITIGVGNANKDESYSVGKRRSCRSITQVGKEMWVGSDGYQSAAGVVTAGILRYDLDGNYLGKYDQTNSNIPFGLTNTSSGAWAMYKDKVGRVWVSTRYPVGIAVRDTNGLWTNIGVPSNIASNAIFQANGITGNYKGEVFFATSQGLLLYKGSGDFKSDTSYDTYTTADGLSSNFVSGVAVGNDGTIWASTDAGINKIAKGDLIVYNLTKDAYNPSVTDQDSVRKIIAAYSSYDPQEIIDRDTLYIAADGSRATVFKYRGSNPKNMAFRIEHENNDGNPYTQDQGGHFVVDYSDDDSIRVQYYHPSYLNEVYSIIPELRGRNLRIKVVDTTATPEQIIFDLPVKVVLPPVLMVHGLWAKGDTWDNFKNFLLTNNHYKYKPYEILTPNYDGDKGFADNYPRIQEFINALLNQCRDNRISAGKVDIAGHSMGGILSRLYLQDIYLYQNNIHKLITINTPHSGSPLANILEDKDSKFRYWIQKIPDVGNLDNGAIRDLKIGFPAIDSMLNGKNKNRIKVPSHVIHSTTKLPDWVETAQGDANNFMNSPTIIKSLTPGGLLSYYGRKKLKKSMVEFKHWIFKNTPCSGDSPIGECMEKIFNGGNDLIVSDDSQMGGMSQAQTYFEGYSHLTVNKEIPVAEKLLDLLREETGNSDFTMDGFNPSYYKWESTIGTVPVQKSRLGTETIKITSPAYGASFDREDSVYITVRASAGIKKMLFAMGYENDLDSWTIESPDSIFSFKVPQDVMSRIDYAIFALDAAGNEYFDSSYITIAPNPALLIDSIKIDHPNIDNLKIPVGDSTQIIVWGYFNDGVTRDITQETDLSYQTLSGSVSVSQEGYVNGLVVGFDELIASYQGTFDTVFLEVIPKIIFDTIPPEALPVRFAKITARFTGKDVLVQWSTAMEQNNDHFEIEFSRDGNHFSTAGIIAATNHKNGSSYSFNHAGYGRGNNYYRVKQVDIDGKISYSEIVVAIVHSTNNISLYPNPVTNEFVIDLSKAPDQRGRVAILYNNLGQIILKKTIAPGQTKINIQARMLSQGIYSVEILDSAKKRIWSERFIKTEN